MLLAPLHSVLAQQSTADLAALETRQPDVQWSPAGAARWVSVPDRQTVSPGDRVRTGPGAAARLVYFEGTVTEVGAETGVLFQRLERGSSGNVITNVFQPAGTTVSRVVQLVDPAATFELETPAATAFVRGTTLRVQVNRDGTTRVGSLRDGAEGTVELQGKDPDRTRVTLRPGEESDVRPGQPPTQPRPLDQRQSRPER